MRGLAVVGLKCLRDRIELSYSLIDDRLYSAILRSLEQTHCACMRFCMSD